MKIIYFYQIETIKQDINDETMQDTTWANGAGSSIYVLKIFFQPIDTYFKNCLKTKQNKTKTGS